MQVFKYVAESKQVFVALQQVFCVQRWYGCLEAYAWY